MCTREIGERAREAAYNLLIVMAETLIRWNNLASKEGKMVNHKFH